MSEATYDTNNLILMSQEEKDSLGYNIGHLKEAIAYLRDKVREKESVDTIKFQDSNSKNVKSNG